ncbi:HNH endonuclease signature motif containing protein [Lignipirellula cremea]|uniref:HNH endonuclease signature motif containing protein n=1 Tax=Lignipirellula cremea TaxID=2528010 RepID=UPI001E3E419A|nr:HNH endonuclease [Lignipirellula cremea]
MLKRHSPQQSIVQKTPVSAPRPPNSPGPAECAFAVPTDRFVNSHYDIDDNTILDKEHYGETNPKILLFATHWWKGYYAGKTRYSPAQIARNLYEAISDSGLTPKTREEILQVGDFPTVSGHADAHAALSQASRIGMDLLRETRNNIAIEVFTAGMGAQSILFAATYADELAKAAQGLRNSYKSRAGFYAYRFAAKVDDATRATNLSIYAKRAGVGDGIFKGWVDAYANAINSNRKNLAWDQIITQFLTEGQQRLIRQYARRHGLINDIEKVRFFGPLNKRYLDFSKVAYELVEPGTSIRTRTVQLPKKWNGIDLWKGDRKRHFQYLDQKYFPGVGRPAGYTWHHMPFSGKMQLVPTGLHNALPHYGGMSPGRWGYTGG